MTISDQDFFWQGSSAKHKFRLAKWDILCRPKDQGGLGILDLQLQNKCLLAKWLVNLLNTTGMWQTLLTNKYLRSKSLTQVKAKPYYSHFWRGLMKIIDEVLANGSFIIKDGCQTRFWDDLGQVTCHSKLNIHQFIILLEIHMLLWLMLWLRNPSIFLLGGFWWIINLWNGKIW